ncbi:MAG: TonB-dependent receptor [Allomuricauda sp.]|nr:MAG: TonB-dependent receptor [Allomuricauda sp.]
MSLNKNYLAIILFTIVPFFGLAQKKVEKDSILTENLDEVVVTATRTIRQLSSLPLPVTLIPKTQLQRTGVTRLNEILSEQTGIVVTTDITTGGDGVQIQGIASDYILVLIDGVPVVGRSSGNLDLSRFAIGNIKQVEIVKGPSSSLFGSEALGGVINIITERPTTEKISGQVSHRSASFNNQNTNLRINQRQGKFGYALFADRLSTDGFDLAPDAEGQTNNAFFNYTFSGRAFFEASEKLDVFASGRYFFQEFDVAPSTSEEKDANIQLRLNHDPAEKTNLQYEFYYTNYITDERSIDPINEELLIENDFNQKLFRPEIRLNQTFSPNSMLTIGGGYNFESLDRSLFAEQVSFDSQYLFAQYDFKPVKNLNVIAGARFDNHSEYNSQLSPKLSARYEITEHLALKGSVGSGFKAPDFRQLYLDFTNALGGGYSVFGKEVEVAGIERLQDNDELANLFVATSELGRPLDAESSVGYNLGLTYKKGKLSSEINFFRNDIKNLIDTQIIATKNNGANVFGYINRERILTQGLEFDLKYRLFNNVNLSAGYQLLYAFDKDQLDAIDNGEVFARDPETLQTFQLSRSDYFGLINRSRHTLNFKAFCEIPNWNANGNLRVVYRSRFGLTDLDGNAILDDFDQSFIDGYALVNLSFGKTFFKNYQLQVGANNLFDFKGQFPQALSPIDAISGTRIDRFVNPGIQLFTKLNIQF